MVSHCETKYCLFCAPWSAIKYDSLVKMPPMVVGKKPIIRMYRGSASSLKGGIVTRVLVGALWVTISLTFSDFKWISNSDHQGETLCLPWERGQKKRSRLMTSRPDSAWRANLYLLVAPKSISYLGLKVEIMIFDQDIWTYFPMTKVESVKLGCQNSVKMQPKCSQNAVKFQTELSQNSVKMQPKFSQNSVKI